ncbi:Swt1 family HEPN domain-containing protein [Citricoccus sp. NR2]|uniref:Swt1 family HEPN domain-containing protein n=1 Tax=Citricoccus sp. NR2 TaxID=3004095 RepID=UPI0022DD6A92|nr:Swt1 family HEPN domain-containing protein [Citricoccus sp. NR2]WBL18040.1 Swt1 family HEPN domain-containing protein [Citricoccus sp. NR2]
MTLTTMPEVDLPSYWISSALKILSPALDQHLARVMAEEIGPDLEWTMVLSELDRQKGVPPRAYEHTDPALQLRMITERLGALGHPFDRGNHRRLFSTYGQVLRLSRNLVAHPGDEIEPFHALTAVNAAAELASYIRAEQTLTSLEQLRAKILIFMYRDTKENPLSDPHPREDHSDVIADDTRVDEVADPTDASEETSPTTVKTAPPAQSSEEKKSSQLSARTSLTQRIIAWEPMEPELIGERDQIENMRTGRARAVVRQALELLVDDYGPIHQDDLVRGVTRMFGVKRTSKKLTKSISHQLQNAPITIDDDGFCWKNDAEPRRWRLFRESSQEQRPIKAISPCELMNLVDVVLAEQASGLAPDELITALGNRFGIQRVFTANADWLKRAIRCAQEAELIHLSDGRYHSVQAMDPSRLGKIVQVAQAGQQGRELR